MNKTQREILKERQLQAKKAAALRKKIAYGIIGVIILALFATIIWVAVNATGKNPDNAVDSGNSTATVKPAHATEKGDGIIVNPGVAKADAPKVSLYFDYLCPHCLQFEKAFGPVLKQLAEAGDIELVNHEVNLFEGDQIGPSTLAGVAAACADEAGVYLKYHEAVFPKMAEANDTLIRDEIPKEIGLSGEKLQKFQKCYDARATLKFVQEMSKTAYNAGIQGTPTVTVNGKQVPLQKLSENPEYQTNPQKLLELLKDSGK